MVSRKHRRFPKPSHDRHSLICSLRIDAVHCSTTWSSYKDKISLKQSRHFDRKTCTEGSVKIAFESKNSLDFKLTITKAKCFGLTIYSETFLFM